MPIGASALLLAQDTKHFGGARVVIMDGDLLAPNTTMVTTPLSLPVLAYSKYLIRTLIAVDANITADMAYEFSLPPNATMTRSVWGSSSGVGAGVLDGTIFKNRSSNSGGVGIGILGGVNLGTVITARIIAVLRTTNYAGHVTFRFAQNVSDASPATLKRDSMMWAVKG